ncbi:S-layer protein [Lysinibacillus alkalisoli]|uniref:S-layer protein n=1 Tax=Lysinibacillus alkalisoli TaxID=1911548 RepID=A0A917D829_9BACI|nr:S-layer homology domain-containing protein [Lysinibacillus alkalisoli]GGG12766.1 S-layer protein [Lysinibacillus alkalisoli]
MANQPKKYQKFVATAATATLVAAAIVPTASAAGFNDTSNYDKETLAELDRAVELGFVKGFENGDFKPADYVTRGQVAKILARHIAAEEGYDTDLNGLKEYVEEFEITDGFSDVSEKRDSELYFASLIVKDAEVFTGNEKNQLLPEKNITRQQMAKVLVNAFGLEGTDKEVEISDLDKATKEFQEYIVILAQNGVTKANPYKPGEAVKRIQMASFSVRAYDASPAADLVEVAALEVKDATTLAVSVTEANKDLTAENFKVQVDGKEVEVKAAASNGDGSIYTLTIASLDGKKGEVEVNGVKKAYDFTATVVESIKAINASELQVNFSQAVDKKTATDKANYQLKVNNDTSASILDIQLSEDGKVATILLDQSVQAKPAFQNGDKYVVQTNDAILSKEGKKIEKFVTAETTFSETAAPGLVKTVKKGDTLEFTFDRPVAKDVTLVKVDGIEIGGKELLPVSVKAGTTDVLGTAGDYRYKVDITNTDAKTQAKKLGEHEVVIFDVLDTSSAYASKASVLNGTYTVTDQVTAPEVTGIEAVNANRFFVSTNVKVDPLTANNFTVNKGAHKFDSKTALVPNETVAVAEVAQTTYKGKEGIWVVVTDAKDGNPLYRANETSVDLTVTFEKYTADGLVGKKSTQNVTLNKNNTKPVVETTTLTKDNKNLEVKFTNTLVLDASPLTETKDFVVRDKDGIIVTGFEAALKDSDAPNKTNDIISLSKKVNPQDPNSALQDLSAAPYTVEFKEGKFKNEENTNTVAGYIVNTVKNSAFTVSVGKEAESNFQYTPFALNQEITNNDKLTTGQYRVKSTFDENSIEFAYPADMSDTARDVANYTLDGKALPAGTTVDFVNDRKTVKIVFPKNTFATGTQYKLGITTNVKTAAGSIIVGSLQTKEPVEKVFTVADNVAPELKSAVYYVGTDDVTNQTKSDQIEVTFNEAIQVASAVNDKDANNKQLAAKDLAVVINGSTYAVTEIAATSKYNGSATVADKDAIDNDKLVLTLESPVNVSQAATITIVPKATSGKSEITIKDIAGNQAKENSSVEAKTSKFNLEYANSLVLKAQQAELAAELAKVTNLTDTNPVAADLEAAYSIDTTKATITSVTSTGNPDEYVVEVTHKTNTALKDTKTVVVTP